MTELYFPVAVICFLLPGGHVSCEGKRTDIVSFDMAGCIKTMNGLALPATPRLDGGYEFMVCLKVQERKAP